MFPLSLSDGEGATIPLGALGEIGFANRGGLLALTVPWGMAGWLRERLGDAIVRGPEEGLSLDGTAKVANAWVRLRAGMRASFPLGRWERRGDLRGSYRITEVEPVRIREGVGDLPEQRVKLDVAERREIGVSVRCVEEHVHEWDVSPPDAKHTEV